MLNRSRSLLFAAVLMSGVLSGCAATVHIPVTRFKSPEASGNLWAGEIRGGLTSTAKITLANDVTAASPNTTPDLGADAILGAGFQLGLSERIDIYTSGVMKGPSFVGLSIQVLGDSVKEAKEGNFSLSLMGGAAFGGATESTTVGSGGSEVKGESSTTFQGHEASVLLGYRPGDRIMFYGGPSLATIKSKTVVERTSGGVKTETANFEGQGNVTAILLGLRLGTEWFLGVEATSSTTKWERTTPSVVAAEAMNQQTAGIHFGGSW